MAGRQTSRRHFVPRLVLALCATVLAIVPFELWARAQYARIHATLADVEDHVPVNAADLKLVDLIRPSRFDDVVYELRPGLAGTYLGKPYQANERGMRDRPLPDHKASNELRVAVLGDSFTFGWAVPVEDSFCDVVERALDGRVAGRRVEMLNFGVPGYNSAQEAACLDHLAIDCELDAIVLQYYYNDRFLPNYLLEKPERPWLCLPQILLGRMSSRAPVAAALSLPGADGGPGDAESVVAPWKEDEKRVPPRYAYMVGHDGVARAFAKIKEIAAARHLPVLVMAITQPTQRMIESDQVVPLDRAGDPKIEALARASGFEFVDTLGMLVTSLRRRGMKLGDVLISQSDWHFNAAGNQLVGAWLADHVAATLAKTPVR